MEKRIEFIEGTEVPYSMNDLPYFEGKEKYWVMSSGKEKDLYDYFDENNTIGLAFDNISVNDVKGKKQIEIKEIVKEKYKHLEDEFDELSGFNRSTTIYSKEIHHFVNEISIGDVVVVKDRNKNRLLFGKVTSDALDPGQERLNMKVDKKRGYCNKVRRVKWLHYKNKDEVSELIRNTITYQRGVYQINDEKVIVDINKTIYSLFYRGEQLHAVFNIKTSSDIKFSEYHEFINLIEECRKEYNIEDEFYIKSNVASPGPIEIYGHSVDIVKILASIGIVAAPSIISNRLKDKYKKSKEELDIDDPGKDDGFRRGN